MTMKKYFDMKMPEIDLPESPEMLGDAIRIKSNSSYESRVAMFKIARFFKHEFHYDGFQYAAHYDIEDDDECHSYVWTVEKSHTKTKSVVVGGFCFRKREWGGFGFQWIWIHPFLRDTGLLTRHWKLLEEKFGKDFYCEPPLSHAMKNFLRKKENSLHLNDPEKKSPGTWITSNYKIK